MRGDEKIIEQPAEGKTDCAAGYTSPEGIGKRFGRDHSCDLASVHSHRPHAAILSDSCGYAHGNAVDDVQYGNQGDDGKKSVHTDDEEQIRTGSALFPFIAEDNFISCSAADGRHVLFCRISPQLNHDERVVRNARQAGEGLCGGDEGDSAASEAIAAEGIVFQQTCNGKGF